VRGKDGAAMNQLTTPGNPMEDFQKRVLEKLQSDIGSLMPPEALEALIQKAVEKTFFEERIIKGDYGRIEHRPSWFVEELTKLGRPLLEAAVKKHVEDNKDTINAGINKFLEANSLSVLVAHFLAEQQRYGLNQIVSDMVRSAMEQRP
jgi:hypothetical protein